MQGGYKIRDCMLNDAPHHDQISRCKNDMGPESVHFEHFGLDWHHAVEGSQDETWLVAHQDLGE